MDQWTGECFRDAALTLLADAQVAADQVTAIGSHGQTLRHQPDADHPFTIQIGDPTIIAKGTGITTVADFRRADMALGGQGAPLTPLFHEWLFRQAGSNSVILNIGGVANITTLPAADQTSSGFDTGPGNTLLDAWINKYRGESFDRNGSWAAEGTIDDDLLSRLLADPYFQAAPPKSTGFEYFNLEWLEAATSCKHCAGRCAGNSMRTDRPECFRSDSEFRSWYLRGICLRWWRSQRGANDATASSCLEIVR